MVGNKRGKKEKTKRRRKECGYVCGGEKKRGEKKRKKEGEPTCVERKKREREKKKEMLSHYFPNKS